MHEEEAVRRAREVVGLYGDPETTWGIGLDTRWRLGIDLGEAQTRLDRLAAERPALGRPPTIRIVPDHVWEHERRDALGKPYDDGTLLRVLASRTGDRLLVTAHHGVLDGLGMVALIERVIGSEIRTRARGVGDSAPARSFLRSTLPRLREALIDPPPRFTGERSSTAGEYVGELALPRSSAGTALIAHCLACVHAGWPQPRPGRRPLFAAGVSRRAPGEHQPDRQTGFVRFRVDPGWDQDRTRAEFAATAPEPDFPETTIGGLAPRVLRLLRHRLGATAQISNLGALDATGLVSASLFPALSGPSAVSVGCVSTAGATTLTLRTRLGEFSREQSDELLNRLAGLVVANAQSG